MSERAIKINRNASSEYRMIADTYKSRENTFNKALELMKLREELSFERAIAVLMHLEAFQKRKGLNLMTVIELINTLKYMPHNAQIYIDLNGDKGIRTPRPEMEWNDHAENYRVVL